MDDDHDAALRLKKKAAPTWSGFRYIPSTTKKVRDHGFSIWVLAAAQQIRQLGEVDRHTARLVLGQQVGGSASAQSLFEIECC